MMVVWIIHEEAEKYSRDSVMHVYCHQNVEMTYLCGKILQLLMVALVLKQSRNLNMKLFDSRS